MKNLSAHKYAQYLVKQRGSKKKALETVNNELGALTFKMSASSNYHQIRFFVNVLKHLL